jgi:hypothetical protein
MLGIAQIKALFSKAVVTDEVFTLYAQVVAKAVKALVNQGFTREEAIGIVSAQGAMIKGLV